MALLTPVHAFTGRTIVQPVTSFTSCIRCQHHVGNIEPRIDYNSRDVHIPVRVQKITSQRASTVFTRGKNKKSLCVEDEGRNHLDILVLLENLAVLDLEPVRVHVYVLVRGQVLLEV